MSPEFLEPYAYECTVTWVQVDQHSQHMKRSIMLPPVLQESDTPSLIETHMCHLVSTLMATG